MKISVEQVDSLQKLSIRRLAEQWLPRLKQHFPARFVGLDEGQARTSMETSIERGLAHGLVTDAELYRFGLARLALGDDFDTDPALPWARELLERDEPAGPRLEALVTLAIAHLEGASV